MITKKHISWALSFCACAVIASQIAPTVSALHTLTQRQISANEELVSWKAAYQALLPVNLLWEKTFIGQEGIKDVLALYRAAQIESSGLSTSADLINQSDAHEVSVNNTPVGLQALCVGTGGSFLVVNADNMRTLLGGLGVLVKRKDLEIGSIKVQVDRDTKVAKAELMPLCVRVRAS